MSVVVTGSAGFLGGHVVDALLADGREVVGIDRRPGRTATPARHLVTDLAAPDADALRALGQAEAVVHLAGCPGVRTTDGDIELRRHRDNVVAGRVVLEAAAPHATVLVASSSSVYGGAARVVGGALRPSREEDLVRPLGGYAVSKVLLERLCAARAARGGAVVVVRPFTVVGAGQRADMALSRWVGAALAGDALEVHGSLDRTRDLTDVGSAARSLARLAGPLAEAVPSTSGVRLLNLGSGVRTPLRDVVRAVRDVVRPAAAVRVIAPHPHDPPHTWAATARAEAVVGPLVPPDLHAAVDAVATAHRGPPRVIAPRRPAGVGGRP